MRSDRGVRLEIRVLGPLEVVVEDRVVPLGAPKQRAVLAALLLEPNHVVPVDRIIEEIWGEAAPRTAQHSVQLYISELRKAFDGEGDEVIATRASGYELHVEPEEIDAVRFEQLAHQGMEEVRSDPAGAASTLGSALDLWRGPALADFAYVEFTQPEIRRLDELRLDTKDARDEALLALGGEGGLVARLGKRVDSHPLRERTRGLYMRALAATGRTAEALRTFEQYRRLMAEELGVEPGSELKRLEEGILLQDPSIEPIPGGGVEPVATRRNPYKGLRPFLEGDAADFHGRVELTEQLVAAISATRFLAVVGPSGSGKSSVVQAGLAAELREDDRLTPIVMVPGVEPFASLHAALIDVGTDSPPALDEGDPSWLVRCVDRVIPTGRELVLIIDQFEELYSLAPDQESGHFLDCIRTAAQDPNGRVRFVACMRADYYDRPLLDPAFGALFTANVVHVAPMSGSELQRAAVEPAKAAGLTFEPALLGALVADVAGQPGGLPLFQFTLTELFDRHTGTTVTAASYEAMGGLHGTLGGRAEEALSRMDSSERDATRQLALRLVTLGEHGMVSRRRVQASELSSLDVDPVILRAVLESLGRSRLLTFDRDPVGGSPTVELAHDALLYHWDRLSSWIEAARTDLRTHAAFAVAVAQWREAGRDPDYLPSGTQLARYETWREGSTMRLTEEEQQYLAEARDRASAAADAEHRRTTEARRLERRARRRSWAAAAMVAVLLTGVIAAVLVSRPGGPRIGFVFDGRGDDAYADLMAQGWDRATRELAFRPEEIVPLVSSSAEVTSLAEAGYDLVVGGGAGHTHAVAEAAARFPEVHFVLVDSSVEVFAEGVLLGFADGDPEIYEPLLEGDKIRFANATSVLFADAEGAFLAGAAAALTSQTGTVGFVGGMPFGFIENMRAGFEAGARHVDPGIEVISTYIADDISGFQKPGRGRTAGHLLYVGGADVIYHAAGASGWGVLDAAAALSTVTGTHAWWIGSDTDQYLQATAQQRPHILTSAMKRTDVGVHIAIEDFLEGTLGPGSRVLGLAEGALGLATSGGRLQPVRDELSEIETLIISKAVDPMSEPRGRVLELPPSTPDAIVTLNHEAERCAFEGDREVPAGSVVGIRLSNQSSDERAWMGIVPLSEPMTLPELEAADDPFGASGPLERLEANGLLMGPQDKDFMTTDQLDPGTYALYCTTTFASPAAVISVR